MFFNAMHDIPGVARAGFLTRIAHFKTDFRTEVWCTDGSEADRIIHIIEWGIELSVRLTGIYPSTYTYLKKTNGPTHYLPQ